jgi:1-acyl-sn-glycerol-3-phosphate acyltransferase
MKNVPRGRAVLILCNHQSYFDPFFSQSWFIRHFYFVARESLYSIKIIGPLLRSLFVIPIRRGEGDIAAMRAIITKLKAGRTVCLYPEGTRSYDGKIAEVQAGFGLLSRRGNADIVPAVIEGAFECWPRNQKWPKPRKVCVMYGEPIPVEEVARLGDREFAKVLTQKLRTMHNELRRKMGRTPFDYRQTETTAATAGTTEGTNQ